MGMPRKRGKHRVNQIYKKGLQLHEFITKSQFRPMIQTRLKSDKLRVELEDPELQRNQRNMKMTQHAVK